MNGCKHPWNFIVDDRARKQYGRKSNPQQKPKLQRAFPADDTETRDAAKSTPGSKKSLKSGMLGFREKFLEKLLQAAKLLSTLASDLAMSKSRCTTQGNPSAVYPCLWGWDSLVGGRGKIEPLPQQQIGSFIPLFIPPGLGIHGHIRRDPSAQNLDAFQCLQTA